LLRVEISGEALATEGMRTEALTCEGFRNKKSGVKQILLRTFPLTKTKN